MSIRLNKSSFIVRAAMLLLTMLTTTGAWAQITVGDEVSLKGALSNGANLQLTADIVLEKYLDIDNMTVTIDLNGHSLSRNLSQNKSDGHVIWVHNGSTLTLKSTAEEDGKIEGGRANNGGAIHIPYGNTVIADHVIFRNNSAADHAGAIWNNGTFTASDCSFLNNTAKDVGAIYNSKTDSGCGIATLTNCTFTGNKGTTGAGALANALGATVMNIKDCAITDNTAGSYGGGIWNGGTLNVEGDLTVTNNKKASGISSNVYLKTGKVITLTGELVEASIGVEMESITGTFTKDYKTYHEQIDPNEFFSSDYSEIASLDLDNENEACLYSTGSVYFIERSWDAENEQVVSTLKALTGSEIGYEVEPSEGQYKKVTSHAEDWFGMGGYSTTVPEYYVVSGDVSRKAIVVQGKDVHLILCDNSKLTLTGGLKLEGNNKLYIHSQSYSGNMGQLIVSNSYENAAGIGSAWDRVNGKDVVKTVGQLVIHGGHIEVTGGDYAAGIGSCRSIDRQIIDLCSSVTVYGGYVKAIGGKNAAGIGGGAGQIPGGTFNLYDGTVIATGGQYAAGLGGGGAFTTFFDEGIGGWGGTVNIYGGELTATGGERGAGIGSGTEAAATIDLSSLVGGIVNIYNGKVTANGGKGAAGIGGGFGKNRRGAKVYIYNGTVTANGGEHGAGFGGGENGEAGTLKVLDGTVTANGGLGAAGVGGGYKGNSILYTDEDVYIAGGTVIARAGEQGGDPNRAFGPGKDCYQPDNATPKIGNYMKVGAGNNGSVEKYVPANERRKACWLYSYAEVSPCTHDGCTYTVTSEKHTRHCNYCADTKEENHFFENGKCVVCNYETDKTYKVTYYLPDLEDEVPNEIYKPIVYQMVPGTISLPICEVIPDGYEFEGWALNPYDYTTYLTRPDEYEVGKLWDSLAEYNITENVGFVARFKEINVTLYDDRFNSETLFAYDGMTAATVTLQGRTLYKDGKWNTLCLPFSLTEEQLTNSPLAGGDIRTLSSALFSSGTLTLNFTEVESITAGTPYIVKWDEGDDIVNPTFNNVKIKYTYLPVEKGVVTFYGNYSPVGVGEGGDNTMLYLGLDDEGKSTLFYPNAAMTINSFRAYFQLNNGLVGGEPSSTEGINNFVLNFGDDTGLTPIPSPRGEGSSYYYSLDGRKLSGKPTRKGVYIHNGQKVVIK